MVCLVTVKHPFSLNVLMVRLKVSLEHPTILANSWNDGRFETKNRPLISSPCFSAKFRRHRPTLPYISNITRLRTCSVVLRNLWERFSRSFIPIVGYFLRRAFKSFRPKRKNSQGSTVMTDAARGADSKIAISPKNSPRPKIARINSCPSFPESRILTFPNKIISKCSPKSPS